MNLRDRLQNQRQAVAEFAEALQIIREKPKYAPAPNTIAPLDILSAKLTEIQDELERAEYLKLAKKSLEEAQATLVDLEREWAEQEAVATAAEKEITEVIEAFNAASSQLADAATRLRELARSHSGIFQQVHGNVNFLRGTGLIESVPTAQWAGKTVLIEPLRLDVRQSTSPFAA